MSDDNELTGRVGRLVLVSALRAAVKEFQTDQDDGWKAIESYLTAEPISVGWFRPKRTRTPDEVKKYYRDHWYHGGPFGVLAENYQLAVRRLNRASDMLRAVDHSAVFDIRLPQSDLRFVRRFLPSEE